MNVENTIEEHYRKLSGSLSSEYEDLYKSVGNERLKASFSTLHAIVVSLFDSMNNRLPTADQPSHFWAEPSRELIQAIEIIEALEDSLKNSEFAFAIDEYYRERLTFCKTFLSKSGGSSIPPNTEKMKLYYSIPIFSPQSSIVIESQKNFSELTLVGEGSYARVFKYFDKFYVKTFALKRAKKNLTPKELQRFRREYEQMRDLSSPYVVEVFGYSETNKEYVMEFIDAPLDEYILRNNGRLPFREKMKLGLQIIKAFTYIHSKQILHRDISPKNILIKKYDDVVVAKVADFGLVKIIDSQLTSDDSDLKGCFNDPNLRVEGFDNYHILHETYALTRILCFVLTGKTRTDKMPANLRSFINKGLNSDMQLRFKDTVELREAFQNIKPE
jgi:tRNA A-37 threonylcarbamoyl transferase component Bud32